MSLHNYKYNYELEGTIHKHLTAYIKNRHKVSEENQQLLDLLVKLFDIKETKGYFKSIKDIFKKVSEIRNSEGLENWFEQHVYPILKQLDLEKEQHWERKFPKESFKTPEPKNLPYKEKKPETSYRSEEPYVSELRLIYLYKQKRLVELGLSGLERQTRDREE